MVTWLDRPGNSTKEENVIGQNSYLQLNATAAALSNIHRLRGIPNKT